MKKTVKIIIVVLLLIVGYMYLYRRHKLAIFGAGLLPINDPYQTLRDNIGDFSQSPDDDGIWHAIYMLYDPDVDKHREFYQNALAFFKGYDLAAKGWELQTVLKDDFEDFRAVYGSVYPDEIEVGEFIS